MAHIRGIKCANGFSSGLSLRELEDSLKQEHNEVLKQEETLWFKCSQSDWIMDGDRNTKYYHRVTGERRNRCSMIKLGNGKWCWIHY
ncbi:hypothetical protein V6N12_065406 [Hibiscus sabdariffa]|uniref:Uncharacterized protein n=1 Tax=Hibiscus sabdariffa TaxID=183260 RepID=A0ABR2G933_9ROSI